MISTNPLAIPSSPVPVGESRVLLRGVDWGVYETLLSTRQELRSPRFSYCQGLLEIMTPSELHEQTSDLIGDFIKILTEEAGLNLKSMGSTTLNRPDLKMGAEPDKCFYIQNEPLVRGKTVDLSTDPPPDLVIEVDIAHTDIDKNVLYAQLGVPEFWRFNGKVLTLYGLSNHQYQDIETSPTFPWMTKEHFYTFLADCRQQGETAAKRALRHWVTKARPPES